MNIRDQVLAHTVETAAAVITQISTVSVARRGFTPGVYRALCLKWDWAFRGGFGDFFVCREWCSPGFGPSLWSSGAGAGSDGAGGVGGGAVVTVGVGGVLVAGVRAGKSVVTGAAGGRIAPKFLWRSSASAKSILLS